MEIRLLEAIQNTIFVGKIHEDESDWSKYSNDWLQGHEEGSNKGRFDDVGILVSKLELIECKYFIELRLPFQIKQPLL